MIFSGIFANTLVVVYWFILSMVSIHYSCIGLCVSENEGVLEVNEPTKLILIRILEPVLEPLTKIKIE